LIGFRHQDLNRANCWAMILIALFVNLAACNHSAPEPQANNTVSEIKANPTDDVKKITFLNLTDGDIAALWMALKDNSDDSTYRPQSEEIAKYEHRIRFLADYLQEDKRMVANRTVQTRDLLAGQDIHESLLTLLDGMVEVAHAGVVGNYGAYCQWYLNQRQSKLDHSATIDNMKKLKHKQQPQALAQ